MRIIARLDIKNDFVIKGIHLEGLRKVGKPNDLALNYYAQGVDEIVFMDAVASLYDRNNLFHIIKEACKKVFIPISIGGGIRKLKDVEKALDAGADKVVINTGCVKNIQLAQEISTKYGSQCLIGSIEAKRKHNDWYSYIDNGREPTNLNVIDWAKRLEDAGVGEILITSIDQEGTKRGFDIDLISKIHEHTNCPIIASGGYGKPKDIKSLFATVKPSAIAFASALHYGNTDVASLRKIIKEII
tara:strand:- start:589 stop:1320 length:732 start_codon:yes stop_codon:yes gene_type:complete